MNNSSAGNSRVESTTRVVAIGGGVRSVGGSGAHSPVLLLNGGGGGGSRAALSRDGNGKIPSFLKQKIWQKMDATIGKWLKNPDT